MAENKICQKKKSENREKGKEEKKLIYLKKYWQRHFYAWVVKVSPAWKLLISDYH